jgi:hypothetical protein
MSESYRRRARRLHEARFPRTKRPGGLLAAPWRPAFPRHRRCAAGRRAPSTPAIPRCWAATTGTAKSHLLIGLGEGRLAERPPGPLRHHRRAGRRAGPWPPANPSCHPPWPATAPCDLLCLDELGYLHLDSQGAELLLAGPDRTPTARLDRGCLQRAVPASGARGSPIPASRPRWSTG